MKMKKKGLALADMYPAVLTIILVGIVLGIGLYVLNQTSDAISTDSKTVVNETLVTVTTSGEAVALITECGFDNFLPISVINATSGTLIPTTNYTYDAALGIISFTAGSTGGFDGSNWNITYSYTGGGTELYCTSLDTTGTGLGGMASWIAIIIVVLAAAVVLGVVMNSFGDKSSV